MILALQSFAPVRFHQ